MSEEVEVVEESQDEAAAMASMLAGYEGSKARTDEVPAEAIPEPKPEQDDPTVKLAGELAGLKAQVKALSSTHDPDTIRKLHGDIGEINRVLKNQQKQEAPADDELTAAMKSAEEVANEFPELAGPLVKALKALNAGRKQPQAEMPDVGSLVSAEVRALRKADAVEALHEEHPDAREISLSPEFDAWVQSKTPDLQVRIRKTENPALASRYLTEFKESLKTKQKKQDRLAGAVTPQGVPQKAGSSTIPDEEGLWAGYNKHKGKRRL